MRRPVLFSVRPNGRPGGRHYRRQNRRLMAPMAPEQPPVALLRLEPATPPVIKVHIAGRAAGEAAWVETTPSLRPDVGSNRHILYS